MDGPLKNLLVVDLTRVLVGPYCTMILSDLGARVIKVEAPEIGDDSRKFGPFIENYSAYFMSLNRGKESIALNLKNNDAVIKVLKLTKKYIACVTKLQKMLIFEKDALPKLQKGGGVQLIKIKKDDFLSDVTQLSIEDGLEWSTGSKNRRFDDVKFWIGKRAQTGKKVPKFFNKNQKFTG